MGRVFFPLDDQLESLGGWSEGAVEMVLWTAQAVSSYREAEEALARLSPVSVSKSQIQRMVEAYGGQLAQQRQEAGEALWESGVKGEEAPPPRDGQKERVGISLDGMMVWVDDGWHEVKVGSCFTFGPGRHGEVETAEVGYWAWYGDVEPFRQTMWWYAYHRGLGWEGQAVVLGDGATWIDGFVETYCPDGVRIVDWYHALQHVWTLGKEAFGDQADQWVEKMERLLWEGHLEEVGAGCEAVLASRKHWSDEAARTANYFRQRADQMRYPAYRQAGYPIGSGTVESGCKGIAWRCRGRGQRWKTKGLRGMLALRSAAMGGPKEWQWAWQQIRQAA